MATLKSQNFLGARGAENFIFESLSPSILEFSPLRFPVSGKSSTIEVDCTNLNFRSLDVENVAKQGYCDKEGHAGLE
jgi:hypothetical protein